MWPGFMLSKLTIETQVLETLLGVGGGESRG